MVTRFGSADDIEGAVRPALANHLTALDATGIAEALLATALGLAAAIPAVVIYNYLARSIAGCKALFANTSTEVLNLTSREIAQPHERKRAPVVPARLPAG